MKDLTEDQVAEAVLRGDMLMVGVYGDGVDITIAINRADIAEVINDFTSHFPARDPMDMATAALRTPTLLVDQLPPQAEAKLIAAALVLANGDPDGIDGVMGIEVTARKKGFLIEIYNLDNLETSETVH